MSASQSLSMVRALVAALLTLTVSQSAMAVFTPSQVPLSLGGQVEPNVMFILDDSGSMRWGYMPDELEAKWNLNACSTSNRGLYAGTYTTFCSITGRRYLASNKVNAVYYNPSATYLPPLREDGSRFTDASFTAAWVDGYTRQGGSVNLSTNYHAIVDPFYYKRYTAGGRQYEGFTVGVTDNSAEAAFYYTFNSSSSCLADPYQDACYTRVSLGSGASSAAKQNFANWFSYYRTRLMVAKAGVSQAFVKQGADIRVGYGAINKTGQAVDSVNTNTIVRGVRRFEGTGRSGFFDWLFASQANGGTPLRRALGDAGEYFSRTDQPGPWSSTPGQTAGQAYSCRQSYTIMTTDGYWNGDAASNGSAQANVDNANGPTIGGPDAQSYRYAPKSPFRDDAGNTLADVAMYYWDRDLHPGLDNRVPTDPANPAFWQHMVTFGVGLGVSGSIDPTGAFAAISTGASVTWLNPTASNPAKLDDLLHAAVNSRGGFFSAKDPQAFANALGDTLSSIADRTGSNTAAVPTARRLDSDTLVYEAFYSSADWSGKLQAKKPIESSAGIVFHEAWEAGGKLGTGVRSLYGHDGESGGGHGLALTWSALSADMKAYFNNTEALFNHLMGSRVNEAPAGLQYRKRNSLLGDIVNSTLVIANKQDWGFQGRVNQNYAQFVASKANKTPALFVGANDGFLHAFNANTGGELFAYMPHGVLPNIKDLASSEYKHRYFVDGKLHVRDAVLNGQWRTVLLGGLGAGGKTLFALDVTNASASGFAADKVLWEIKDDADLGYSFGEPLVGRLKDGTWVAIFGNGYGSGSDDSVLFIVELETGVAHKVRAGTATGGLSSPSFVYAVDADKHIYVSDIYAGDLQGNLWKFNLKNSGSGAGDFEVSLKSGNVPQPLYIAADAQGNRQPITVKPEISLHPNGEHSGYLIYFGTGRMYTAGDTSDRSVQTIYGVWDKKASNGSSMAFSGRSALEARSILFEGPAFKRLVRVLDAPTDSDGIDWSRKRGWYLDLVSPVSGAQGERVIVYPRILLNRLVIETAIPSADPCQGGGSGWTLVVDPTTGGRLSTPLFDLNHDGKFDEADMILVDGKRLPISGIGSSNGIPTGSFDLFDGKKYLLCKGTGVDDCIPADNSLNVIDGRQSWNQTR